MLKHSPHIERCCKQCVGFTDNFMHATPKERTSIILKVGDSRGKEALGSLPCIWLRQHSAVGDHNGVNIHHSAEALQSIQVIGTHGPHPLTVASANLEERKGGGGVGGWRRGRGEE